jgi:hypothetical protein
MRAELKHGFWEAVMNADIRRIIDMLYFTPGGYTDRRMTKALQVFNQLTPEEQGKFRIEEFKRGTRPETLLSRMIGSGGNDKGNCYPYEIWAVWS